MGIDPSSVCLSNLYVRVVIDMVCECVCVCVSAFGVSVGVYEGG